MDWTRAIDAYCERTDAGFWSEPANALTNAALLLAAWIMWRRVRGRGMPLAAALCAVLAAIGVGSFLFHSLATAWASLADTVPIAAFILLYLFATNRLVWRLPAWASALGAAAFIPWAALLTPAFRALRFFQISAFYWPVPLLIAAYAVALRRRAPETARGFALGAALLVLSLALRSIDGAVCPAFPLGAHFLWHLLNALMLGWMIEVLARHILAERGRGR